MTYRHSKGEITIKKNVLLDVKKVTIIYFLGIKYDLIGDDCIDIIKHNKIEIIVVECFFFSMEARFFSIVYFLFEANMMN